MSKANTRATINANIKQNGNQEITGQVLNSVLNEIVDDYAEQEKLTELESKVGNFGQLYDKDGNKVTSSDINISTGVYLKKNGRLAYNAIYAITDFIDLSGLGDITYSGRILDFSVVPYALFYDSEKKVILGSELMTSTTAQFSATFTPPANAAYVRFNTYCRDVIFGIKSEFNYADELNIRQNNISAKADNAKANADMLTSWIYNKTGELTSLSGLTDANGIYIDRYGVYQYGASYGISQPIYIKGIETINYTGYIVDKGVVAIAKFMDKNKAFISVVMSSAENMSINPSVIEIPVPSNAYYVVFCCHKTATKFLTSVKDNAINILRAEINRPKPLIYDDYKEKDIYDDRIIKLKETVGFCAIINKWGFIGDSLSSGLFQWVESGSEPQFTDYEYSWGQMLIARIGHATGTNFSVGGLTAKAWFSRYITNSTPGYNYKSTGTVFANDLKQAYTIMLGTNDSNYHISVGNFSTDVNLSDYTQNADTFCGNYAKIIQKIKELQPSSKIFVITIPTLFASYAESEGYNAIIRQMASEFSNVFLVDLYALIPSIRIQLQNLFRIDGHGTSTGYQWISCIISTIIDNVIENNLDSFKWVCRIGTQYDNGDL